MSNYDLEKMSLKELKKLQNDLGKAISSLADRQKAEARSQLDAIAKDLGYSLAELTGGPTKKTRVPTSAKYQHPENAAVTWSGRGRRPQWFIDARAAGKTPDELAIA